MPGHRTGRLPHTGSGKWAVSHCLRGRLILTGAGLSCGEIQGMIEAM